MTTPERRSDLFNSPEFHTGVPPRRRRRSLRKWFKEHPKKALGVAGGVVAGMTSVLVLVNTGFTTAGNLKILPSDSPSPSAAEAASPEFEPAAELTATLVGTTVPCSEVVVPPGSGVVLDADDAGNDHTAYAAAIADQAMNAGGAADGAVTARLTLATGTDRTFTVHDVRAEDVKVLAPVDGPLLVPSPCAASEVDQMAYLLNAPDPGPFAIDQEPPHSVLEDQRFFDSMVIEVTQADKQNLDVTFQVADAHGGDVAYEFVIAVDVEADGELFSVTVDRDGRPFRVSSQDSCEYDHVTVPGAIWEPEWDFLETTPAEYFSIECE